MARPARSAGRIPLFSGQAVSAVRSLAAIRGRLDQAGVARTTLDTNQTGSQAEAGKLVKQS